MVGLARVVLYRRERLLMLAPRGKGIVATLLRYKNEVRDERQYFDDIPDVKISKDMLELAIHIIKSKKTGHFDPAKFEDRYENALHRADQGQAGRQDAARRAVAAAEQRHQPDGRLAPQRAGRAGRCFRCRPARPRRLASAQHRKRAAVQAQEAQEGELKGLRRWACRSTIASASST